jgi:hypothetical protein
LTGVFLGPGVIGARDATELLPFCPGESLCTFQCLVSHVWSIYLGLVGLYFLQTKCCHALLVFWLFINLSIYQAVCDRN